MSEQNAVKLKMNFLYSSKSVCFQMRTVLTECLRQAVYDALNAEYGNEFFSVLKRELPQLLRDEDDVFLCGTETLLGILSLQCTCVEVIAKRYGAEREALNLAAQQLLKLVEDPSFEAENNIENERFKKYIECILKLSEFFTTVRDVDGELFYLKLITRFSAIKNKENYAPVYNISKIIASEDLDIEYPDFIICCREADASVCTEDGELCFSTNEPEKVMEQVHRFEEANRVKKEKKDKKLAFIKIAAIIIAVIIAAASAWISNVITRTVINKDPNDTVWQSNTNSTTLFDNSKTSSGDVAGAYKTKVEKSVDSAGRVTESYLASFRYKGETALSNTNYELYNCDIDAQEVVAISLRDFTYSQEDGGKLEIYVQNKTGKLIRNISFEIRMYTENNENICGIATQKMMADNNISLNLNDGESEKVSTTFTEDKWYKPNADLSFVNMTVKISYDIVQ